MTFPAFDYVSEVSLVALKKLFEKYYRKHTPAIPDVEHRELAYVPFTTKHVMIRHCIWTDVINRLGEIVPRHLYNSVAYYERPYVENMEGKGFIEAPLVFDIDCDHIPYAKGKEYPVMLEYAKDNASRLVDCLIDEMGTDPRHIHVYFSGHRGYHIYVDDKEVMKLGRLERHEIISYVKLDGYNPNKDRDKTHRKLVRGAIYIDESVTADLHRLIRSVGSLHGKTGFAVVHVDNLDSFRPLEDAVVFGDEEMVVRAVQHCEFTVMGHKYRLEKGKRYKLPEYAAAYAFGHRCAIL